MFNQNSIVPAKKKSVVMYSFYFLIIAFCLLLIFGRPLLYSVLALFFKDTVSPDDSSLMLTEVKTSKEDNAYYDLINASSSMSMLTESEKVIVSNSSKYISGEILWNTEIINAVLIKNAKAFAYFKEGSLKKEYQNPFSENPNKINFEMTLPPLNTFRNLASLYSLKAMQLNKEGSVDESIDDAFVIVRIGSLMQEAHIPSVIEVLVGVADKNIGLSVLESVVSDTKISQIQRQKISQSISQYFDNRTGASNALKAEYISAKTALISMTHSLEPISLDGDGTTFKPYPYVFQPNRTLEYFVKTTQNDITIITTKCNDGVTLLDKISQVQGIEFIMAMIKPNGVGKIVADTHRSAGLGVALKKKICEQDMRIDALVNQKTSYFGT